MPHLLYRWTRRRRQRLSSSHRFEPHRGRGGSRPRPEVTRVDEVVVLQFGGSVSVGIVAAHLGKLVPALLCVVGGAVAEAAGGFGRGRTAWGFAGGCKRERFCLRMV